MNVKALLNTVTLAHLVKVLVCGTGCRGFKSTSAPPFNLINKDFTDNFLFLLLYLNIHLHHNYF